MRRREFLGATALLPGLSPLLARLARAEAPPAFARFEPIEPSDADHLVLPEGFRYDVVIKWGDPFTASGDLFGYNNDFIGAFALKDEEEALLVVNHEYISLAYGGCALYPETFRALRGRNPTVDDYKDDVGFTQPDNLLFDARGDLWVTTDISSHVVNEAADFQVYRNSGLFRISVGAREGGSLTQFASMPCEAEPTGPAWAPGELALLLSVQHPGERYGTRTEFLAPPRGSNWPRRVPGAPPQPAVVAIRRA